MKVTAYWDKIVPILALIAYFLGFSYGNIFIQLTVGVLLIFSVLAAVHNSEVIAHKVGEPYGTIILAIAITVIEASLIISLMIAGGEKTIYLARDTVFSAVMIILNIIIGLCIVVGSIKHFEQIFQKKSVNTALVSLIAIIVLTLILPNFTTSIEGPRYTIYQLFFVAMACLIIYGTFLFVQTIRHKNYFQTPTQKALDDNHADNSGNIYYNLIFLIIGLIAVVLLAKSLSPTIESAVISANLPQSLVGIIIASVIMLPEAIAAIKAAHKNDFQTSLNLSLGSALAAIGLTIPSVAVVSYLLDINIVLGLEMKSMVLLGLSLFTVMLSLSKGKTNIIYGVILIVNFFAYIFTTIVP